MEYSLFSFFFVCLSSISKPVLFMLKLNPHIKPSAVVVGVASARRKDQDQGSDMHKKPLIMASMGMVAVSFKCDV